MSTLLTSGLVGNIKYNHLKAIRESVKNKWEELGFLDELEEGIVKENIASLYENTAEALITESTDTGSSGSFETVVFPMVRRIFSKLLANDIVSVQAMNMPIGKLFYFVPVTSERNSDGTHTSLGRKNLPACVGSDECELTEFQAKNLYDLFYEDGLFDHSKGALTIVSGSTAQIVTIGTDGNPVPQASAATAKLDVDGNLRTLVISVSGFTSNRAGRLIGPSGNEMDTEAFLASLKIVNNCGDLVDVDGRVLIADGASVPFNVVTQKYGKGIVQYGDICDANGKIYLALDLSQPVSATGTQTSDGYIGVDAATASGVTAACFGYAFARYEDLEFATEMGEVSFKLDEVVVSVTDRQLRANWSPQLAKDVNAFHSIDAEAELTSVMSQQVASELDREILLDLRKGAAWTSRWDYNGWRKASSAANPYTQKEWNQTLIEEINFISAQIFKSTLMGGANFIVVSAMVSALFRNLEYFHVTNASPEQDKYNMGIERIGTLDGLVQVYRDPYLTEGTIILGHKGDSILNTGYFYAPYVPVQLTPTLINYNNFTNVKGIMTRYAKKFVNNRFYGRINVDGLRKFDNSLLR